LLYGSHLDDQGPYFWKCELLPALREAMGLGVPRDDGVDWPTSPRVGRDSTVGAGEKRLGPGTQEWWDAHRRPRWQTGAKKVLGQ